MRFRILLTLLCINCCLEQSEAQTLDQNFLNPPESAKPRTWYHVNSGNMSKEGFTKDLEAIQKVGIGGILVFNVSMGVPKGNVTFNSDEHTQILKHAAIRSESLGLAFGVHNCDGWTSSGGPWVNPEQAMKIVVNSEVVIKGGKNLNLQLPLPPTRKNFYRDIAVVAYPSLTSEVADNEAKAIITSSDSDFNVTVATDKKIDASTDLNGTTNEKAWVQFDYGKPHTIRGMSVFINHRFATAELMKSDDGVNFSPVYTPVNQRIGKKELFFYDSFGAATARYFRLVTKEKLTIFEMKLMSTYSIGNFLGQISFTRSKKPIGNPESSMIIDKNKILNLTASMDSLGKLSTTLPEGNWTILRFGYTSSGEQNSPASDEGRGLETDKFNKEATKLHYDAYVGKLVREVKPLAPKSMQYIEIDSYEVGPLNWTDDLEIIFKKTYGYDFVPFLPLFAGRFVESPTATDGVFWDMKRLLNKLMVENYYDYFTELCHRDGLKTYIEPYGFVGPFNSLDAGAKADIPMGEFWLGKPTNHKRAAVSVGHIYNKNVISAEAFTSTFNNWGFHPALAKQKGDYEWTNGINEFMFHRFAHQSNTHVKPGMSMYDVGSHIDRTQTWWENAGADWFRYLARGSYMLRQGIPVNDLLVFVGDEAPNHIVNSTDFKPELPSAFKYDCVNADVIINRLTAKNGRLVLPEGTLYRALVLHNCEKMSIETLRRLAELADQSIVIIGEKPKKPGGYSVSKELTDEFNRLVASIWSKKSSYNNYDWTKIFAEINLQPDLKVANRPDFNFIHRRTATEDIYFIYNHDSAQTQTLECDFKVGDKIPEVWNAMTGEITKLAQFYSSNGRTIVPITLNAEESAFVVFRESSKGSDRISFTPKDNIPDPVFSFNKSNQIEITVAANGTYSSIINNTQNWEVTVTDIPEPIQIDGNWTIAFRKEDNHEETINTNTLFDWSKHQIEGIKYYSGTAIYKTTFNVAKKTIRPDRIFELQLGKVFIAAKVILNGKDLGILWVQPYKMNITNTLKEGENELIIELTNQWTNRLIGDEKLPNSTGYELRTQKSNDLMPEWFRNNQPIPPGLRTTFSAFSFQKATDELVPSGLIGPVKISILKKIKKHN